VTEPLAFVAGSRRAALATLRSDGRPRLVPVCFVLVEPPAGSAIVYTPIDEKPKASADVGRLGRLRDIAGRPEVALLVDRWSEDWSRLGWVRLDGVATVLEAGSSAEGERVAAIQALRQKYPQYRTHRLEDRPLIRIEVGRISSWGDPR
jgi:PPOX class probable F420-dependent enzyme